MREKRSEEWKRFDGETWRGDVGWEAGDQDGKDG
jgi:hypothetical protein